MTDKFEAKLYSTPVGQGTHVETISSDNISTLSLVDLVRLNKSVTIVGPDGTITMFEPKFHSESKTLS